ncbi:hypothetical protein K492DRAFT_203562 [Lichtheimia hyalospora FSU 10163]|nr:hypothetical protein K492DRAFT_203562 [Lichtheimia hyalospora FSU 10163]
MNSSTRAASLIKPYLRKVVLQTHPDFFQSDPIKAKHNAASLQQLYTILNPILKQDNRSKSKSDIEASHDNDNIPVAFYPKHANQATSRVSISFDPRPVSVWHTAASVLDLCKRLDINVATSDEQAVHQMISKVMASSNTQRSSYKSLREEFVRALYKQHQQQPPSPQVKHWTTRDIFNNRHLMFAPSVDKKLMATRLAQWLNELHPERWWGQLPVLVLSATASLSPDRTKGILVLTSEMNLEEMKCYLEKHVAIKKREYQEMGKKNS